MLNKQNEKVNAKHISEVTWAESNQPTTVALVIVDKFFNIYNYKTAEFSMKAANILAVGGTLILTDNKASITIKLQDEAAVLNYQLQQLEYLISKYTKITGFYAKLAYEHFGSRAEAIKFFQSTNWKENKLFKLNALDALREPLVEFEEAKRVNILHWSESMRVTSLWNEAAKMRVFFKDTKKDLPNQDVTAPVQPMVQGQIKYSEEGPYATFTGDYWSTPADELEQKIVNAWFYNHEEFRKPTEDELANELEELREWFEQYKYNARRNKVTRPQAETVSKFERLEYLEVEVGTYLNDRLLSVKLYG